MALGIIRLGLAEVWHLIGLLEGDFFRITFAFSGTERDTGSITFFVMFWFAKQGIMILCFSFFYRLPD